MRPPQTSLPALQLYTISKEREGITWRFAAFRLAMDFLQLYLLIVDPMFGWDINDASP